jgi:hypothetical protein
MPPKQHSRDNAPPVEGRKKQPPQVTQEKPATRKKAQAQAHAKHKHKEGTAPNLTPPSNTTTTPSKTWLKKQKYAAAAARSRQQHLNEPDHVREQ